MNTNRYYNILALLISFLIISGCKNDDIILNPGEPSIGDYYEGGYIFYIDNQSRVGYVCAPADQGSDVPWWNGFNINTGATASGVGFGYSNTIAIVNAQGNGYYAAKVCYDLVLNGYSDWYLPSKDELTLMYENLYKQGIGDLAYGVYWSSTEYNSVSAWNMLFINSMQLYPYKSGAYDVRAVRSFSF